MQEWIIPFALMVLAGGLGQFTRMVTQWKRDDYVWPHELNGTVLLLLIGCMAGWLSWEFTRVPIELVAEVLPDIVIQLVQIQRVFAFAFGFMFVDVVETLTKGWFTKGA